MTRLDPFFPGRIPFLVVLAILFLALPGTAPAQAQQPTLVPVRADLLNRYWDAKWIAPPDTPPLDFGVYHFRKELDLSGVPQTFVVHVSGDNRYRLFVNGVQVVNGPARGDLPNWRFESIDLAPYLKAGQNVIAATVWNFAEHRPIAQHSYRTGFLLQGDTEREAVLNTGPSWKTYRDEGYAPIPIPRGLPGYFAAGPGERMEAAAYPWGWLEAGFNDTAWADAAVVQDRPQPKGVSAFGERSGWMLVPRDIPLMEERPLPISHIVRAEGLNLGNTRSVRDAFLEIPAGGTATVLLDQRHLTTGYPVLVTSGGAGATVRLTYAEALFNPDGTKGNRDETDGKEMRGFYDEFVLDGGDRRQFQTLWWRTWRYLQIDVQAGAEPVVIHDFSSIFTAYPFEQNGSFTSDDASMQDIWNVGWRTARLCAGETYFDCPYYEQLQYLGDTRIQALISLYVSGDDRLMRQAISQLDHSRIPDGITASRHPSYLPQYIPPFSFFWVAMVHDYWQHRDDPAFAESFQTGIKGVLEWFEGHIDETGMLGPMPYWSFADWSYPRGVPPGAEDGNSAVLTVQFLYALNYAAEMAEAFGRYTDAGHYRTVAGGLKAALRFNTWDEGRGLFADTPDKQAFSQHTNLMAVLTDLVPPEEQPALMERVLSDPDLVPVTYYYRFYLNRALEKAGMGDRYVGMLTPWRQMLALGLTTFAEEPEPTRSDSHAWSASPNYDFLSIVAGITPASPGFKTVRIAPSFGPLTWVKGEVPHPAGPITVDLKRTGQNGIEGQITLPEGVTGSFEWQGKAVALHGGPQRVQL